MPHTVLRPLALAIAFVVAEKQSLADQPPTPLPELVLTDEAIKGLKEFQDKVGSTGHGYLAVSPDGANWAYWLCSSASCLGQRSQDKAKALADCRSSNYGVDCIILAQDQAVLLEYLGPPNPKRPKPQMAASHPPAPPADQIAREGHPGWTVDALNGCWIWNRKPFLDYFITWSGTCAPEGPATGPGLLDWGDERFYGALKDGRKTGSGLLIDEWGGHVRGMWKDGVLDGPVAYAWADGSHYDGPFVKGYPNGHGVFTDKGKTYEGEWKDGCLVDKRIDWSIYGEADCK